MQKENDFFKSKIVMERQFSTKEYIFSCFVKIFMLQYSTLLCQAKDVAIDC